jgi:hypothetical protein
MSTRSLGLAADQVADGDPLTRITADAWNAAAAAGAAFRGGSFSIQGEGVTTDTIPSLTALVRNNGPDVAIGDVLSLSGSPVTLSATTGIVGQQSSPILDAWPADSFPDRVCVALLPISENAIGPVVFLGLAIATVRNTGESAAIASLDGTANRLVTSVTGAIPILHLPVNSGQTGPAIVLLTGAVRSRQTYRLFMTNWKCNNNGTATMEWSQALAPIAAVLSVTVARQKPGGTTPVANRLVTATCTNHKGPTVVGTTGAGGIVTLDLVAGTWSITVALLSGETTIAPYPGAYTVAEFAGTVTSGAVTITITGGEEPTSPPPPPTTPPTLPPPPTTPPPP